MKNNLPNFKIEKGNEILRVKSASNLKKSSYSSQNHHSTSKPGTALLVDRLHKEGLEKKKK